MRRGRVSRGSMTSSIWPTSAARYGLKNASRYWRTYSAVAAAGIVGGADLAVVEDPDGGLRAHDRDLGAGPGERDVGPHLARAHRHVGAAHRPPGDDRDLRDRRLAVGVDDLRPVADDALVLLVDAGQEARAVHERDDRDVVDVADPDEPGDLVAGVDVEDAGHDRGLAGDDPDREPVEPGEADDGIRGVGRVDLEEAVAIEDAAEDVADVVGLGLVVGDQRVERVVHPFGRVVRGDLRRVLVVVLGQVAEEAA